MKPRMLMLFAAARSLIQASVRVICSAFYRLRSMARANRSNELSGLRCRIEALADQFDELKREIVPAQSGPGLNLSKRLQALRMHGRGDTARQIAAALEVPVPEIELLIKVHCIVTSS